MTRSQRTVHARTFAVLTPLLLLLVASALVRALRTESQLHERANAPAAAASVP